MEIGIDNIHTSEKDLEVNLWEMLGEWCVSYITMGLQPIAHSMKPKLQQNTSSNVVSLPFFSKALPAFVHILFAVTFCALFMSQLR